jgi:hypothetical protein
MKQIIAIALLYCASVQAMEQINYETIEHYVDQVMGETTMLLNEIEEGGQTFGQLMKLMKNVGKLVGFVDCKLIRNEEKAKELVESLTAIEISLSSEKESKTIDIQEEKLNIEK